METIMAFTTFLGRTRAQGLSGILEVILGDCDDRILADMGLLRDPANRLMKAPAEDYDFRDASKAA
jgi:hypothetical protein